MIYISHALVCSIQRGNERAPSAVSDVDCYVIIIKVLDFLFNILLVFLRPWEVNSYVGIFFCKVAFMRHNVL
jgi:hypothetical protein